MPSKNELFRTKNDTPVWVSGIGRTVIFVHGVLVDHRMWDQQVNALSSLYRICCMEMFGHGKAPDPPGNRNLSDFVSQISEVVDQFSDKGPPILCGYSMGGLVSQAYAIEHHIELSGLILMSTVHDRSVEESKTVIERYETNISYGVDNAIMSASKRWLKKKDYRTHAADIEKTLGLMRDGNFVSKCKAHRVFATSDGEVTGKLGNISCPTLILTGQEDTGSTPEMAKKMAKAIQNSELHIFDGQHHLLPVLDAARINGALLRFLKKCWNS